MSVTERAVHLIQIADFRQLPAFAKLPFGWDCLGDLTILAEPPMRSLNIGLCNRSRRNRAHGHRSPPKLPINFPYVNNDPCIDSDQQFARIGSLGHRPPPPRLIDQRRSCLNVINPALLPLRYAHEECASTCFHFFSCLSLFYRSARISCTPLPGRITQRRN